jgi:GTP-binding protein Era
MPDATPRAGRCAIVGKPNVGKSTLLNQLLGQKLAIATPKRQTTRNAILGVYVATSPPTQIAFVDTPGMHRPKNALGRALVEEVKAGLEGADVVLWLTETRKQATPASFLTAEDEEVAALLAGQKRPVIMAINKIDRQKDKAALLPILASLDQRFGFAALVPISAQTGENTEALIRVVREHLPEGALYDEDVLTDRPERFFVAELIREAVIAHTRQEVPHGVAVLIDEMLDDRGLTRISATIVVEKPSQKGILIGSGGQQLKQIGTHARHEIERFLERKVYLKLWVKVIKGWSNDPARVRELAQEARS